MRHVWAAVAVVVALAGCTSEPAAAPRPPGTPTPVQGAPRAEGAPAGEAWRTEVWRDVQLEVPAGWRLGYAPMTERREVLLCGIGSHERTRAPYVGRPGHGSDVCLVEEPEEVALDGAGLWFGSPLPVGEAIAKTGLHQVTVATASGRVTVASKREKLLDRVLRSVERVDDDAHGCPSRPAPERRYPDEGYGEPLSFAVCVYDRDRSRGGWKRFWTTVLPAARAERFLATVEAAEPGPRCAEEVGQLVLMRVTTDDPMGDEPLLRDFIARPSRCAALQQAGPAEHEWLRLAPELVRPWAVDGVSTYVYANGLPRPVARLLRPVWG